MQLNFNWINLLILFGAVQGMVFGIFLIFKRKHPGAVFLSALVLTLAYNGFETFNWSAGLDQSVVFFDLFPFIIIFAIGPSLYLYTSSLLYPDKKFSSKKIWMHYSPILIQFVVRSGIILYYVLWHSRIVVSNIFPERLDYYYGLYSEPLSVIVFLIYLGLSIRLFRRVPRDNQFKDLSREGQRIVLKWIRALLICMVVLGIAWPLTVITPVLFDLDYDVSYYPIELALVLFIYWIAMTGYHRTRVIFVKSLDEGTKSRMKSAFTMHLSRLVHSMEAEKLYLDPQLNLNKLAAHTGLSPKTISAILNQHHQVTFNDFINGYRVKEVCSKLADPGYQHFTISGVALEAGFNSQATFQRAFKLHTGMSPKTYIEQRLRQTA